MSATVPHSREFWIRAAEDIDRFQGSAGWVLMQERLAMNIRAETDSALTLSAKEMGGAPAAAARAMAWRGFEGWLKGLSDDARTQASFMDKDKR